MTLRRARALRATCYDLALKHYAYCLQQCVLIHVEQSYEENDYTLRGNRTHRRVDEAETKMRDDVRVERGLPLPS